MFTLVLVLLHNMVEETPEIFFNDRKDQSIENRITCVTEHLSTV